VTTSPDLAAFRRQPPDAGELARAAIDRGAVQHEAELTELISFLQTRRPLWQVLEIGVMHGGTLWLWRRLVGLSPGHLVVGVDLQPPTCDDCDYRRAHVDCPLRLVQSNVYTTGGREAWAELIVADSQNAKTAARIRRRFPDGIDLLHIDGDHGPGVYRDFDLYSPLVNRDGTIVLHDVTLADAAGWPPAALWESLRAAPGAFTISHEGGYGFGVLAGPAWRTHLYEG
jgi:hypothetical protein